MKTPMRLASFAFAAAAVFVASFAIGARFDPITSSPTSSPSTTVHRDGH